MKSGSKTLQIFCILSRKMAISFTERIFFPITTSSTRKLSWTRSVIFRAAWERKLDDDRAQTLAVLLGRQRWRYKLEVARYITCLRIKFTYGRIMISLEGWGAIGQSVPKNISCRGKTAGKEKRS